MATNDTIQLMEDAVQDRLPPGTTEDDMYEALDNCSMTEREIYGALERKYGETLNAMSDAELAVDIRFLLFDRFDLALEDTLTKKEPVYG